MTSVAHVAPANLPGTRQQRKASSTPDAIEVRGKIQRVLFSDEETRRAIVLVRDAKGRQLKLTGYAGLVVEVGRDIRATCTTEVHEKYGEQLKAEVILEDIPLDREGAVAYLSRTLEGVGRATAERIFDAFGEKTYDVLQQEPWRLQEIPGIGEGRVKAIADSFSESSTLRALWTALGKYGVGGAIPARIYAAYGERSLAVLRMRPYQLTQVEGIGFKTADMLAQESGVAADSPERISAAIRFAVDNATQQGHTSVPVASLKRAVNDLTGLTTSDGRAAVAAVLAEMCKPDAAGGLVHRVIDGKDHLSRAGFVKDEESIARRLHELDDGVAPDHFLAERAEMLAESLGDADQKRAVARAFLSAVSVITGGPGCGKTTVTRVIARTAKEAGMKVVICAPTGKAARRATEATGFPGSTAHSVIGFKPNAAGGVEYEHSEENPLEADLFILDEGSMMDTSITAAFLAAVRTGARVVIVGDADQLSSVGAGNVLRDIIDSGCVAVTKLKTVHRTAANSDIVVNAHRVIAGDTTGFDLKGDKDLHFRSALADETVAKAVQSYQELAERHGSDNVQVLAARRGTDCGVQALNEALRSVANPPAANKPYVERGATQYRLYDRVMRTSNSRQMGVSNGEVGTIIGVDQESKSVTVGFGDRAVVHSRAELVHLEHAWAMTTHKSQGSEYAGVVFVAPRAHGFMLTRELLYTGMTRGKKDVHLCGDEETIRRAIRRVGSRRYTGLKRELTLRFGKDQAMAPAVQRPPAGAAPLPIAAANRTEGTANPVAPAASNEPDAFELTSPPPGAPRRRRARA